MRIVAIEIYGIYPFRTPFRMEGLTSRTLIVGRNGSGKSTLLRALAGFLDDKQIANLIPSVLICADGAYISVDFEDKDVIYTVKKILKVMRGKVSFSSVLITPEANPDFILIQEKMRGIFCSAERYFGEGSEEIERGEERLRESLLSYLDGITNDLEDQLKRVGQNYRSCGPFQFTTSIDWKKAVKTELSFSGEHENCEESFCALSSGDRRMTMIQIALAEATFNSLSPLLFDDAESFLDAVRFAEFLSAIDAIKNPIFLSTHIASVARNLSPEFDLRIVDVTYDAMKSTTSDYSQYLSHYLL